MSEKHLISLLQRKRGYFETLLELAEHEQMLPLQDWISVLEQKKVILSCIDEIDEQLAPFKERFSHLSHEMHEELESMKQLVKKILFLDSRNQEKRKEMLKESHESPRREF